MTTVRGTDVLWLLFLVGLAALGLTRPERSLLEPVALLALGVVQIAEGRLGWADSPGPSMWAIGFKLALCYLLIWETGGIESSYYLIFLLPIVSGASYFRLTGALVTAAVSSGLYLSFLLYVLDRYYLPADGQFELAIRVLFFFLSAILVNRLMEKDRLQTERLGDAYRDLSQAKDEVQRSERLAALGQLSAGLAHEIRNPLGVISASAELLHKNVSTENEVAREVAGMIGTEVNRTNALVTRFLDFARPSTLHRGVQDLNEVVKQAIGQLQGGDGVEVVSDLTPMQPFSFDATLIESSVHNLLLNARDAMLDGGRIVVETSSEGGKAFITVADTGSGIPPDKVEDIFNPFFTTKAHGVGLGLAMVSKFVDSHGGQISVESKEGVGTTFRIALPITKDE